MKALGLVLFLFIPYTGYAGSFVQKNMYSQANLAVGVGKTLAKAIQDAKAGIPTGTKNDFYEPDSNFNGPETQCIDGMIWTEKDECWGSDVQYVIPLRHVTR